ncbi:MAG: efflux RND transporter periplasmic adaptor subunit [Arcobacteraceae bacterium]|nr:efflux RND transporter periplasmic adaptor subunit [Arcobacteraceae bacterium]
MIRKSLWVLFIALNVYANPSLVEVVQIQKAHVNPLQEFVGTLRFDKNSVLAAQNEGIVRAIHFEVGDFVKKNQVLVQIDSQLLEAQIKAAQANLESAKSQNNNALKDYERYEKLLESKSITQKEYDDALLQSTSALNQVEALKARLNELYIQKEQKSIKAPYDGIIVEKMINLGEWASSGKALVKMVNTQVAEFNFSVPLYIIEGLKQNQTYEIVVNNQIIQAKLLAAIPNGDSLTRTFPIKFKATLEKGFFYDGQDAKIALSKKGEIEAFVVPRDAVIKRFEQTVIFVVNEELQAVMIPVQIVGYLGSNVAIDAQGINENMRVVFKGNERIFPNSPLQIINNK